MILVEENALGSILGIVNSRSGKNLRYCHLLLEVSILGRYAGHFLPLLQHFLKADQVQSLNNVMIRSLERSRSGVL